MTEGDTIEKLRILVLDDQMLVGMDVAMMLEDWGYEPVGPYSRLSQALQAVDKDPPDAAILDVNLGNGETSLPLAHHLSDKDIPFMFLTGYDASRYDDGTDIVGKAPHMRKPLQEAGLRRMIEVLAGSPAEV
jgi:CheY-like chemotaxis protein